MARKAREISLIDSYTVVFSSAKDVTFDKEDMQGFLNTVNSFKLNENYEVLAYHLQPNIFYLVLADIHIGIDVLLRKVSTSFAKKYNYKHNHKGVVFGDRATTTPAETYTQVYNMICKIHSLNKITPSEFNSEKNYFDNNHIDHDYILQRFGSEQNFNSFCEKYNKENNESTLVKLSDEELGKYIHDTFNLTSVEIQQMPRGVISKVIDQVVKITKASARQISRVTSLPLRFLWGLLNKNKKTKVENNEIEK